jgi:histidine ammonia-lyase
VSAVTLGGPDGLTVEDVEAVARGGAAVALAPDVLPRLAASRAALDRAAAGGQAIYGYNTGLGAKSGTAVEGDAAAFQLMFLDGRSIAMGPPLPREGVRAAMLARAAGIAAGGSGLSPAIFETLVGALNAGVHPVMPGSGSIGAADLGLMAALGQALVGRGEAEFRGRVMPAAEALALAGLAPAVLAPKDGLSLISAGSVAIGQGALVVGEARRLAQRQLEAAALTLEGLGANLTILDPRIQAARPAPGQAAAAAALRSMLAGSGLHAMPVPLQDPLSIRCLAPIHGALTSAVAVAAAAVELELRSAADNPLVVAEDGFVASTGNFQAPALALAFEGLGLAIGQAAAATVARFTHLTGPGRNGLPRNLSRRGGASAGFVSLQKTAAALLAGLRHAALPVVLDIVPVSEGVEDHATQAPLAVAKTARILELWWRLVALEAMAGAEAVDCRPGHRLGVGTAALHGAVRGIVAPLDIDRPLGIDAERLARHLGAGRGSGEPAALSAWSSA